MVKLSEFWKRFPHITSSSYKYPTFPDSIFKFRVKFSFSTSPKSSKIVYHRTWRLVLFPSQKFIIFDNQNYLIEKKNQSSVCIRITFIRNFIHRFNKNELRSQKIVSLPLHMGQGYIKLCLWFNINKIKSDVRALNDMRSSRVRLDV